MTRLWIPDNLKSAVTPACRYEPTVQRDYQELAEHYGVAILPARPYKPRDKAKVEVAVHLEETRCIKEDSVRGAAQKLAWLPPPNRKRSSSYYWAHVRRLCRLADVPVICPHSLRGLHATLALEGGATADSVAKALGHGSFAMTARHYATESSVLDAQSSRVSSALAAHPDSQIEWARLLKGLPAERLPELFVYLRTQCSGVQQLDDKPQT